MQAVLNGILAPEGAQFLSEDHVRLCRVCVENDTRNTRNHTEKFDELVLLWQFRSVYDENHHGLPAVNAVPDEHMAKQSLACFFVVGRYLIELHIIQDRFENFAVVLSSDFAVCHRNNIVRASRVKTADRIAVFVGSDRHLFLVAVMEWIVHPDDRTHHSVHRVRVKTPDADEVISHFILFEFQLTLVAECLDLAAAAFISDVAFRFDSVRRCLVNGHKFCKRILRLCLHDLRRDLIADDCILDEERIALLRVANPLTVLIHVRDFHVQYIIFVIWSSYFSSQNYHPFLKNGPAAYLPLSVIISLFGLI